MNENNQGIHDTKASSAAALALSIFLLIAIVGSIVFTVYLSKQPSGENVVHVLTGPTGPAGNMGISGSQIATGPVGPPGPSASNTSYIKFLAFPSTSFVYFGKSSSDNIGAWITTLPSSLFDSNTEIVSVLYRAPIFKATNFSIRWTRDNVAFPASTLWVPSTFSSVLSYDQYTSNYCGFDARFIVPASSAISDETSVQMQAGQPYLLLNIKQDEATHFGKNQYNGYILNQFDNTKLNPDSTFYVAYYTAYEYIKQITITSNSETLLIISSVTAKDIFGNAVDLSSGFERVFQTTTYRSETLLYGPQQAITPGASTPSALADIQAGYQWIYRFSGSNQSLSSITITYTPPYSGLPVSSLEGVSVSLQNINDQTVFDVIMRDPYSNTFTINT